ncbi:hypothetical protein Tco_1106763 [Tanacetum coccineum]
MYSPPPLRFYTGLAGIVQTAKLLKQTDIQNGGEECVMSTQEYIKKVVEGVGKDKDFKRGSWVSAIEFMNAYGGIMSGCLRDIKHFLKNGKLDQVVAIVKSCTPNVLDNLTVTLKDLSCTIAGSIITKSLIKGVMERILLSGNGVGGSRMLDGEEIMKLLGEEEMVELELQVCRNVTDQEDLYNFDKEALNLALEEEARQVIYVLHALNL